MKRIAVLALQGAFLEHEQMLQRMGVDTFEVRQLSDWKQPKDGLIIPGGESTTMRKLLCELELFHPVQDAIHNGLPVFGTCAGLILLGHGAAEEKETLSFGTMDIVARRNAYGRQLGSFFTEGTMHDVGECVPMTFIRAPYIESANDGVEVLSTVNGHIVAARQDNQLVTAFHPELNEDTRVHEYFLKMT